MTPTDSGNDMRAFIVRWWANRASGLAESLVAIERAAAMAPTDPLAAVTLLNEAASAQTLCLWADQIEAMRRFGSAVGEHHATPL